MVHAANKMGHINTSLKTVTMTTQYACACNKMQKQRILLFNGTAYALEA